MDYSTLILYATLIAIIGLCIALILFKKDLKKKKSSSSDSSVSHTQEIHTVSNAFVLQKIDQRKRIINEYHYTKIVNPSYELVFQLENGELLTLKCSKSTHKDIPFRKTGELKYNQHRLVCFKTEDRTYSDGYLTDKIQM